MTFKHIDFNDSPTMRELARLAIANKTLPGPSLKEVIQQAKQASLNHSDKDNLMVNLVSLATVLREKGFFEKAISLENKIFAFKKAADQYNQEMLAAHPDGDTTMGEASNELGDVETLPSQHQKILETVQKKPTGKNASIAYLLQSTKDILGLRKSAQEFTEVDTPEDVFSGQSAIRVSRIAEINQYIGSEFPKISGILKSQDLDPNKWLFTFASIYGGSPELRALYSSQANVDVNAVNTYIQTNEALVGKNFSGDFQSKILATLQALASNREFTKLVAYGNLISGIGNKYFLGSQPDSGKASFAGDHPERAGELIFKDNPGSIWKWSGWSENFNFDGGKLQTVAREMEAGHFSNFTNIFGEEKLTSANTKLKELIRNVIAPWNEVIEFFSTIPEIPEKATSIAGLVSGIASQPEKLSLYRGKSLRLAKLIELAGIMFPGWTPNLSEKATEAINEINNAVAFLNSKPLNPGDVVVLNANDVITTLINAAKMYWLAGKSLDPASKAFQEFAQNQRVTFNLAKAVKAAVGKPYTVLYQGAVKEVFPEATTYEKLAQEAQRWLVESAETTKIPVGNVANAAQFNLLVKRAEGLVRKSPGASVKTPAPGSSTQSSPSSSATRTNLGLSKANMNDPKEVAVATMQQYLAYFAQALSDPAFKDKFTDYDPQDIARIVRTGPKANPAVNTYDGKWGSDTESALTLANKYLKQLGLNALDTKARYANRVTSGDAVEVAKSNSAVLSQAVQVLSGKTNAGSNSVSSNTVYDRLPERLDWNTVEYPMIQHKIPVTASDLNNLGSFYDMILKNNWAPVESAKDSEGFDVEGFTAKNLLLMIRWFQRRAQFVYNVSFKTDKSGAALARRYYGSAKSLEGQLAALMQARGGISEETANLLLDEETLKEYSNSVGSSPDDRRSNRAMRPPSGRVTPGNYQNVGYQNAVYRTNTDGAEGLDWKTPRHADEGPPIGPDGVINLASRWFNGLDGKLGVQHNPMLNPDMFRRYSSGDLARTFYAGMVGDMDQQARQQALLAAGLETEGFDPSTGDYIVLHYDPVMGRKVRTYAMKVPAYQQAYRARLIAGPMRAFANLMQTVSASLGPAIADWIRSTQPNATAQQAEEAWHLEWQRILGSRITEAVT